jgi:hypothetical protein
MVAEELLLEMQMAQLVGQIQVQVAEQALMPNLALAVEAEFA